MPSLWLNCRCLRLAVVGVDSFVCELRTLGLVKKLDPHGFVSGIGVEGSVAGEDKNRRRNSSTVGPKSDSAQESRGLCLGRDIIPATTMRFFQARVAREAARDIWCR